MKFGVKTPTDSSIREFLSLYKYSNQYFWGEHIVYSRIRLIGTECMWRMVPVPHMLSGEFLSCIISLSAARPT